MVYISQLYTANNYFIRETPISIDKQNLELADKLNTLLNQPAITNYQIDEIGKELNNKLTDLDNNAFDISQYITVLKQVARRGYISKEEYLELRNPKMSNLFIDSGEDIIFLRDNYLELIKSYNFSSSEKETLLRFWKKNKAIYKTPNRLQLLELLEKSKISIKNKLNELISLTPININLKDKNFSETEQVFFKDKSIIDKDYFLSLDQRKWEYFLKIESFLNSKKNPEIVSSKTFLYWFAQINYKFCKSNRAPIFTISNKAGDCTENVSLYLVNLREANAKNIKIFYIKENHEKEAHAILSFEKDNMFYICDLGGIRTGNNFKQLLLKTFPEITEITKVAPELHLNPNKAPDNYFDNLPYQDIGFFDYDK